MTVGIPGIEKLTQFIIHHLIPVSVFSDDKLSAALASAGITQEMSGNTRLLFTVDPSEGGALARFLKLPLDALNAVTKAGVGLVLHSKRRVGIYAHHSTPHPKHRR